MVDVMMLWAAVRFALGVAAGVTSLVWAIVVYRAGVAGTRVAAITNQLTLAAICQTNNGTLDDVLCGSYLAAFNKNFAAILAAVASGKGVKPIDLVPSDAKHFPLGIAAVLVITFFSTAVGTLVATQVAGRWLSDVENREKEKEIDNVKLETSGENKAPGIFQVKALRA